MLNSINTNDLLTESGNPYRASHYLLFGDESSERYDKVFDCEGAKAYLAKTGIATDGSLTQARMLKDKAGLYAGYRDATERYCDFCGRPLSGVEYDRLKDGRDRCLECSETVIRGKEHFEALFHQVREGFIEKYAIDLPSQMTVQVVSTKKLARTAGKDFVPSKYFDSRAGGLAINRKGRYGVIFENGVPRISLIATTAHELTHVWQYSHWDDAAIKNKYGDLSLAVYEGMAKWAEIQYLFLMNETAQAERTLESEFARDDVYGFGLRLFMSEYPFSKGIILEGDTPFNHINEPIRMSK